MDKKIQLEELESLDLKKCNTVSDIVKGMSKCSFGARMLGEVTDSLENLISKKDKPTIIFDGKRDTNLSRLLIRMRERGWFKNIIFPETYTNKKRSPEKNIIVIDRFSERCEDAIYKRPDRAIFINQHELARPGQAKDGYFPDVVFSDPKYVVPVLFHALEERLDGNRCTIDRFMSNIEKYGGLAWHVAQGAKNFSAMVQNKKCTNFLTISGAMTIAKMGLIICDLIDAGMVDYIATTGALMAHGLVESVGLKHYKYNPKYIDDELAKLKLNRVTDTLEPESNLDHIEDIVSRILDSIDDSKPISPSVLHRMIGAHLSKNYPNERGILKSAYEKNVPVVVPAFVDSELGNDVYTNNLKRLKEGKPKILMDMELDTKVLLELMTNAILAGIFTVGGGVPRNNTQNVAPLIEIINNRLRLDLKQTTFFYGTRIAPDAMHYGHLGGCSYNENKSWRKMHLRGRFVEIRGDATKILPFIAKYALERKSA